MTGINNLRAKGIHLPDWRVLMSPDIAETSLMALAEEAEEPKGLAAVVHNGNDRKIIECVKGEAAKVAAMIRIKAAGVKVRTSCFQGWKAGDLIVSPDIINEIEENARHYLPKDGTAADIYKDAQALIEEIRKFNDKVNAASGGRACGVQLSQLPICVIAPASGGLEIQGRAFMYLL